MKKKASILSLLMICVLLTPVLASGAAVLSAASGSVTSFVNSTKSMVKYDYAFNKASSAQDYLDIVTDAQFQQDVEALIDGYYYLQSGGWLADSLAENLSFQQSVENLLARAEALSSAATTEYFSLISSRGFLQDVVNFIDSYYRLPTSLYYDSDYDDWVYDDWTYDDTQQSGFYPIYSLRTGIAATLTMKMATRLGPNTAYSEELGTFPQTTSIRVFEQAMGNDVPWVMVEFMYKGQRYRAYNRNEANLREPDRSLGQRRSHAGDYPQPNRSLLRTGVRLRQAPVQRSGQYVPGGVRGGKRVPAVRLPARRRADPRLYPLGFADRVAGTVDCRAPRKSPGPLRTGAFARRRNAHFYRRNV